MQRQIIRQLEAAKKRNNGPYYEPSLNVIEKLNYGKFARTTVRPPPSAVERVGADDDDNKKKLRWQEFNAAAYVAATGLRPGEDAYARNKFNKRESDKLNPARSVPDTRNYKSVMRCCWCFSNLIKKWFLFRRFARFSLEF